MLPGGADWQVIRADGVADLDARYTLETADGALIYVRNRGYATAPPRSCSKLAAGEAGRSRRSTTCAPRRWFETGDARYAWLNRIVCVGTGARRAAAVELEVFEVK